jgi:hypothetical protein
MNRTEEDEAVTNHNPTISRFPYFSTPFVYWVYCSCGLYRPNKSANDLEAWKHWLDHKKANTTVLPHSLDLPTI